jgi:hypothetical protein
MNRKELEELIDSEVDRILSNMNMREPQPEQVESGQITQVNTAPSRPTLSEEELDDFLFYGGKKPEQYK